MEDPQAGDYFIHYDTREPVRKPQTVVVWGFVAFFAIHLYARYRNVTVWPRTQFAFGANALSPTPFVTSFATAHATASV